MLCLCCCTGFSLVAASRGYSLIVVAQASHRNGFSCCGAQALGCEGVRSSGSRALEHRLSSCGAGTQLLHSMWDPPGIGARIEPMSPALAGGFFTTEPPGKPMI